MIFDDSPFGMEGLIRLIYHFKRIFKKGQDDLNTRIDTLSSDVNTAMAKIVSDQNKVNTEIKKTIADNKTATDTAISNLTTTVTNNKTAIEKTVSDLTTTVTNNKTATDKAINDLKSAIAIQEVY